MSVLSGKMYYTIV